MLAKTPPMGWNSWNTFGVEINDKIIRETADAMVDLGYLDVGYNYLVIDDCWSEMQRDAQGRLVADRNKFPEGMKATADYVHEKGLKFGMYSCAGVRTCAGYPSSYGHEFEDARQFASWGVDFLKYDFCNFPSSGNGKNAYYTMSLALKATNREILFSPCQWGTDTPGRWMKSVGAHMYRSTGDIVDNFESFKNIAVSQIPDLCESSQGCFNDMDMLIVGMYGKGHVGLEGCNDEEYKTHFALWCLFGSPLIMGGDIRHLSETSRLLLQNKELLAINQDEECRPPQLVCDQMNQYSFVKHMSNNEFILAYFNFNDKESEVQLTFTIAGLPYYSGFGFEMVDIFTHEEIGIKYDYYNPVLPPHGCKLYRARLKRYE